VRSRSEYDHHNAHVPPFYGGREGAHPRPSYERAMSHRQQQAYVERSTGKHALPLLIGVGLIGAVVLISVLAVNAPPPAQRSNDRLVSDMRPVPSVDSTLAISNLRASAVTVSSDLLHTDVKAVVVAARRIQIEAERTERRALAAAQRAVAGAQGVGVLDYASGDQYRGEAIGQMRHGVGVYSWTTDRDITFAGQFRDDVITGLGVKRWGDGAVFAGSRDSRTGAGFGVFTYADGGRYEGQWQYSVPNGLGALWAADGSLLSQGVWAENRLVGALEAELD